MAEETEAERVIKNHQKWLKAHRPKPNGGNGGGGGGGQGGSR